MTSWTISGLRRRMATIYLEERGFGSGREFYDTMVQMLEPGDVFLDAGCGESRLRNVTPPTVLYLGVDRYFGRQENEYRNWRMVPDVLGDVHQLPICNDACRVVAFMHVLEHVRRPREVLSELARVLKPGGHLFLDVPFLHEIHHAPHDYFRFTPYALRSLADECGLTTIEIRPSGGYFRCVARILEQAPGVVSGPGAVAAMTRLFVAYPLKLAGWIIKRGQYLLDLHDRRQEFTAGYHCIFRKPVE